MRSGKGWVWNGTDIFTQIPLVILESQGFQLTGRRLRCPRRIREDELGEKLVVSATKAKEETHRSDAV